MLRSALRTIEETKAIAADTMVTIHINNGRIEAVTKDVNEIDSNLTIASKHVRTFTRRLATDKIIMGFVLLIFIAVVFIIVSILSSYIYFSLTDTGVENFEQLVEYVRQNSYVWK